MSTVVLELLHVGAELVGIEEWHLDREMLAIFFKPELATRTGNILMPVIDQPSESC